VVPDKNLEAEVKELWPEIAEIQNADLREKTLRTWCVAFERSALEPADLKIIPFTLLIPDCKVSFINHKRAVYHVAMDSARAMNRFFGDELGADMDILAAGGILIDVGKLLEYEKVDGKVVQSSRGKLLRHPFSGAGLCQEMGLPDKVTHMVAAHSKEGNLSKRTVEAWIIFHADFVSFDALRDSLRVD
jgi:putative nucleotidyltransferase with HDIG domain